jgi:hypothetical protein
VTTFLVVYRGPTIGEARMVAVSADPDLVALVSTRLLDEPLEPENDPVVTQLERGRRAALRLIKREAAVQNGGRHDNSEG